MRNNSLLNLIYFIIDSEFLFFDEEFLGIFDLKCLDFLILLKMKYFFWNLFGDLFLFIIIKNCAKKWIVLNIAIAIISNILIIFILNFFNLKTF